MRTAVWTDSVSVLDRVSAVLDVFDDDDGLGVSEIARRANLPKSTVSRIVSDLVRQRYLDREDDRLHLGLRLFELGQAVERPRRLRQIAYPVMAHLLKVTGENVKLGVLDGADVMLIAALSGRTGVARHVLAGARAPAHATALGKAILAHTSDDVTAAFDEDLQRELAEIRRTGIASNSDGLEGAWVASPILAPGSPPVGAIALSGSKDAVDAPRLGGLVRAAAASLSRGLGQNLVERNGVGANRTHPVPGI
jgi:IclR family acetate operon transcriptional repressor